jgi:WD40 repeat protein
LLSLDSVPSAPPRLVGRHPDWVSGLRFHPNGRRLASADKGGEIRIWNLESGLDLPERVLHHLPGWVEGLRFDAAGSKLAAVAEHAAVWNLEYPPEADPLLIPYGDLINEAAFHPDGRWLATGNLTGVSLWPIERPYPLVLKGHEDEVERVAFLPDGKSLASVSRDGTLRLWPLSEAATGGSRILFDGGDTFLTRLAVDFSGERLLVSSSSRSIWLVPLDGGPPQKLGSFDYSIQGLALGEGTAVAIMRTNEQGGDVIRVWDLETGEVQNLETGEGTTIADQRLAPGGYLATFGSDGIRIWNLAEGSSRTVREPLGISDLSRDGRFLLIGGDLRENDEAVLHDLEQGTSLRLDSHGSAGWVALDPGGRIAVTTGEGRIRIGPATGEAPHLLIGPESFEWPVVSPDGRWITTLDRSDTITLWPIPDLSRRPLHTLPYDQLLAKLRSLTNLRVVEDPESSSGWGWDIDPFPGWEELPTW